MFDLDLSPAENLGRIAEAKRMHIQDMTVVILDRPRHVELIDAVRAAGCRIKMILDGDVSAAIMTATPGTGVDVLMGIGGAPEAVIAAAAMTCIGGGMQTRVWPRNEEERALVEQQGIDTKRKFAVTDLVSGQNVFFQPPGSLMENF